MLIEGHSGFAPISIVLEVCVIMGFGMFFLRIFITSLS